MRFMRRTIGVVGLITLLAAARGSALSAETPPAAVVPTSSSARTVTDGMVVSIDYTLTVDGKVVDSSQGRSPLRYVHGRRQIIRGLERALEGLRVGDTKEVTVKPEDAYGAVNPTLVMEVTKASLPAGVPPKAGTVFRYADDKGRPIRATIKDVKENTVVLDGNHPLAGKTLTFTVKIADIQPAQPS